MAVLLDGTLLQDYKSKNRRRSITNQVRQNNPDIGRNELDRLYASLLRHDSRRVMTGVLIVMMSFRGGKTPPKVREYGRIE